MGETCGRILSDAEDINYFLKNALHIDEVYHGEDYSRCIRKLTTAAMVNEHITGKDTLSSAGFRLPPYTDDASRQHLRNIIYKELTTKKRPRRDDDIKLGSGGARPRTSCRRERNAFYVIGLPASGKSEISNLLSDQFGAIIVDSDFAKRKFPEYESEYGASVVHEESSIVTFGGQGKFSQEPNVLQFALEGGYNVVIPKIGNARDKVLQFAAGLKQLNYIVHLVLVRLDREKATQRALFRYDRTGRYVPLQLIFDVYGNDPTITFYDMVMLDENQTFYSYTMLSSDVPKDAKKELLYRSERSPITKEILG